MPSNPYWTEADEQLLREHHANGTPRAEIAKLLGRTVISIKTRIGRLGLGKDRRWSEADKQFAIEQRGTLTAEQIATHLGRPKTTVYQLWNRLNLCERRRDGRPLQAFIREKHPLGWSDAEIAAAWNAANPSEAVSREWVCEVRRDKCGLPHNAYSDHRRQKVAAKTRKQIAAAGVNSLAEVRRLAFNNFATRHGWLQIFAHVLCRSSICFTRRVRTRASKSPRRSRCRGRARARVCAATIRKVRISLT